jgi:hypothetical protein
MKCEIINGWLVVEPSSETERWAFQEWLKARNSWDNVNSCVRVAEPPHEEPAQHPYQIIQMQHEVV